MDNKSPINAIFNNILNNSLDSFPYYLIFNRLICMISPTYLSILSTVFSMLDYLPHQDGDVNERTRLLADPIHRSASDPVAAE